MGFEPQTSQFIVQHTHHYLSGIVVKSVIVGETCKVYEIRFVNQTTRLVDYVG